MDPLIQILNLLNTERVEFVLIGGMAAIAHGSPVVTQDLDICVTFDEVNLPKILAAIRPIHPKVRHRPDKMPLPEDPERLRNLKNLYLDTDLGKFDLLGELPGICTFAELQGRTVLMDIGGFQCRVLDLDTLIAAKRVAGRDKDIIGVRHLEAIKKRLAENPGLFE